MTAVIVLVAALLLFSLKKGGTPLTGDTMSILIPKLKSYEGFSAVPYPDHSQTSTGYGTKYIPGVTPNPITRAQAETEMIRQVNEVYLPGVKNDLAAKGIEWDELPATKQAAILSFAYNLGPYICGSATWPEKWKAGNIAGAKASWLAHNRASGEENPVLVERRKSEWGMFEKGVW